MGRGHGADDTSPDFLDQIDHAQRPGLLAQRVDGLLNALLLLGGQVDLSKTCAVAVDRCSENAEPLSKSFGTSDALSACRL